MKKFSFGYIALLISIALVISAGFVFATEYFGLSESNPLVVLFFYIVLIVDHPDFWKKLIPFKDDDKEK